MLKSILQPVLRPVLTSAFGANPLFPRPPELIWGSDIYEWTDCTDTSRMTLSGNDIVNITEKSSNSRVFSQATASRRPLLNSEGALFDGTSDFLSHPASYLYNISGGIYCFFVQKVTNTAAGAGDCWRGEFLNSSTTQQYLINCRSTVTNSRNKVSSQIRNTGTFYLTQSATTANDDSFSNNFSCVEILDLKGAGYSNWVNGVLQKSNVADTIARNGFSWTGNVSTIGAIQNSTLSGFVSGTLRHSFVVNPSAVTIAKKQETLAWFLIDAGRRQDLPNDNPYK